MAAENEVLVALAAFDVIIDRFELQMSNKMEDLGPLLHAYKIGLAEVVKTGMSAHTYGTTIQGPIETKLTEMATLVNDTLQEISTYGDPITNAL